MDERDEDAERDTKHSCAGAAEFCGRVAAMLEGLVAVLLEGESAGEEDDVLAVEFHGGGVHLKVVWAG